MSDADSENLPFDTADQDGSASVVSPGEAALVNAARNGDREAFGQLYQRYERRVTRVIRRFVPDIELASDLAQESFLRAWERLDQFDTSRRFGPWLFRLAVNLTYDSLRRIKRRGRWSVFSDLGEGSVPEPARADQRTDRDLAQEVHAVMEQVPEAYRIVLVLRDLEGFCTSEVAAITDRSEATIRWRLAEARRLFKEAWERRERSIEETKL
ncbi:MAG: sigma-70 family RNA polymerase sigma factor [Planctomyces sp.]|nr:sigma-70 family RNA polymerase sigma factor [Planctomyces sp.]